MKFYRALLHAYPASFRAEYGEEMCAIHAQRRRDASNGLLLALLWIETFFDVVENAWSVHLDILGQDLRYAARTLGRSPGFATAAMVVAALGIGATTAAFTMVDHILLRPFPFADQDRLVRLYEDHSFTSYRDFDVAPANYRDWKQMSTSFESMACYRGLMVNMIGEGDPRQITGSAVTAEMFPTLGVKPALGRSFSAEDDRESASGTVVLSDRLWRGAFGGDASVLGRTIVLDNEPYTVIGVMPRNFFFPTNDALLWTAMRFRAQDFADRTNTYLYGIGRLKRGVSIEQAGSEMRIIALQMQRAYPKELAHIGVTLEGLRDDIGPRSRLMLYVLLGASACVLLVACTNLANLLLARALSRRKELAVRAAMGAGRERLIRQMLTESMLLSATGGAVGVLLAYLSLPMLVKLVPVYLPIAPMPSIDLRVLLFAAAATCGTGIAFGLIPALRVFRATDSGGLREGSRSGVGGRKERLRSALVVAEVTGSVVLLVACGLLLRALWRVQSTDPGFRAENVLTLRTSLPMPKYSKASTREEFYGRVLSEARQLPGVVGAAYISFLPLAAERGGLWPVEVEGHPQPVSERQSASSRFVTPGYFAVMGIPLLAGRDVADSDTVNSPFVAVVSESFARYYWPHENPIGRHFTFALRDRIIVGIAGNVRVRGLERSSEPQVYLAYKQVPDGALTWYAPKDLAVRATVDGATLAPALRRIVRETDPEQPVSNVRMLADLVHAETASRRVQAIALGSFALIAFLLAAVGIHGLLSFAVSSRTQEIGVRMALGARAGDILRMILRDGLILAGLGIGCGAVAAYATGRGLQSLLAGVDPGDLTTFSCAIILCVLMTLAGSAIPALRAIRLDAATAIRAD